APAHEPRGQGPGASAAAGARLRGPDERGGAAGAGGRVAEGGALPRARGRADLGGRLRARRRGGARAGGGGGQAMTTLAPTPAISTTPARTAVPSPVKNIAAIARRELREAVRSRWFLLYTVAFAALGLGVSYLSAASAGGSGLASFGRTTAGLINLVLLVVPLMALTAGAGAIASDRERGMLAYLLAQPVSRWEVLFGKYAAAALTLFTSVCTGFGLCAAVLATQGAGVTAGNYLLLVGLTLFLA